ncbi:DUF3021 family protein [Clostridioides sp. ZZV15-6388]|uniref:DUF3021 family protein n=1 Tax=unclassified Clostridioides TaxID=2635829 RepID=UPI001D13037C|nr:DUF3021 family protein [Clostridioides sp. ZZV15-6388]MCC0669736.1 DUF3021 family protein [Clostridioides sp. ZZV14-6153]
MNLINILKNVVRYFCMITTGVLISVFTFCLLFSPDETFSISIFQQILLIALVTSLSTLIFYSKRELGRKELLIRQVIHMIFLFVFVMWFSFKSNWIDSGHIFQALFIALSIFIIYLCITLATCKRDKKESILLNKGLKEYRKNKISK